MADKSADDRTMCTPLISLLSATYRQKELIYLNSQRF